LTPRWRTWLLAGLALAVIVGAIYLPILRRRLQLAAKLQQQTTEQARRELTQTIPVNPGEPRVKAKLFWASGNGDGALVLVLRCGKKGICFQSIVYFKSRCSRCDAINATNVCG
jgi:hypothetical protein